MLWDSFQVSNKKKWYGVFCTVFIPISQKPFSLTCWYVYFNFKFHFFDMSWPPNCPYHAWRPLAGPLKVGRCSLSRHSLVQLIHHKQLQRFKDFEVAGYQLECQRLTDPTKKQMRKKQRRREKEGDFLCVWGEAEDRWWRQFEMLFRNFNLKHQLDISRYISIFGGLKLTHPTRITVPHEPRLLQLWFRVAMAFRPPPRQSGEVCLVGCVFNIYISPETWNIF